MTPPVAEWSARCLVLAALALTIRDQGEPVGTAAADVLAAAGLGPDLLAAVRFTPAQLGGLGAAPLLKTAALVSGQVDTWGEHDDGRCERGQAVALPGDVRADDAASVPRTRRATGHRRRAMLDVGTGLGALGIASPRLPEPARHRSGCPAAGSTARRRDHQPGRPADRMEVRSQDVSALDEPETFDLAWIPAPFVPEPAFSAGVSRMAAALRPGGMLMIGHGKFGQDALDDALTRFQTIAYGGTRSTTPEPRRCSSRAAFVMLDRSSSTGAPASRSHSNSRRSGSTDSGRRSSHVDGPGARVSDALRRW